MSSPAGSAHRGHWWLFWALMAIGAALRATVALTTGAVHPDEIFQYLEQAHRLAFGYGIVPWEYRLGMRNWLLPLALTPPMRLGELIAPGGNLYLVLPKLMMAGFSLLVLPAAYALGARLSRVHGFVAMAVAATWFEIVYYGGHVLTEPAAVALILPAAALLAKEDQTPRRVALAGFLLGLAALLRFHYLPAIAVFALLTCTNSWRGRFLPALAGGAAAMAVGALVDIVTIGTPFGWALVNFHQNIIVNRSADFGVAPPQAYLATINSSWQLATLPILALTLPVLRRFYALMAMAAVNLAVHSAIGHKEYRFIFLSVAIVVIVAVIGSAELVWRNRERLSGGRLRLFAGGLVAAWIALSAALGSASWLNYGWQQFAAGSQAVTALRSEPSLCGVGLLRVGFWDTGGYTYLHRPLPIYVISDLPAQAAAFDSIIADRSSVGAIPPAYSRSFCSSDGRLCTFVRPGGCESNAAAQQRLDRVMVRRNW